MTGRGPFIVFIKTVLLLIYLLLLLKWSVPRSFVRSYTFKRLWAQIYVVSTPLIIMVMVLMVKSGRCGHFVADNLRAACAQSSAYGRKVAKATAMFGRTGVDSFLFAVVIGCHETLALLDSGLFSQFLLQKNCSCGESSASHAPLSDGCNQCETKRQLGDVRGVQMQRFWMSICHVYSGSSPRNCQSSKESQDHFY